MKKTIKSLWAVLAIMAAATMTSCSSDDDGLKSYALTVNMTLPDGVSADDLENFILVTTKGSTSDTVSLSSAAAQTITLTQGQYTVSVAGKLKDDVATYTYVNGTTSVDLFADNAVSVALSKIIQSPLVFKEIYTTGGKAGYMKDSYFEIVNNSDEVQYLDGLILSAPQGGQTQANAWQAAGMTNLYASGQGTVVAFPGNGTDYPLLPGQSVVVANDAANHSQLAGDGNNCPDLSNADWEIYISNVTGEIDYDNAPNLNVIFQNNTYMKAFALGFFSRGFILAKLPAGMTPEAYAADPNNLQTTPGTTSDRQYLMIPSKYVLDAVDMWDGDEETHYGTFLPSDDAQGVYGSTAWGGKCIRRKVTKIENGRPYYQDTNNSANDFLNNQDPKPGVTPTTVD